MSERTKIYFASDFHLGIPNHKDSIDRERKIVSWLNNIKKDAAEKRKKEKESLVKKAGALSAKDVVTATVKDVLTENGIRSTGKAKGIF